VRSLVFGVFVGGFLIRCLGRGTSRTSVPAALWGWASLDVHFGSLQPCSISFGVAASAKLSTGHFREPRGFLHVNLRKNPRSSSFAFFSPSMQCFHSCARSSLFRVLLLGNSFGETSLRVASYTHKRTSSKPLGCLG